MSPAAACSAALLAGERAHEATQDRLRNGLLHWSLVAAFGTAFVSGLRIATEAPGRGWINWFDAVLPRESVWVAHMQAAVALVTVSLAYAVYLARSGLGRRIRLDQIRLRGLFGRRHARLGAYNIVLYWIFFATMLALIASGGLLYFGFTRPRHGDAALVRNVGDNGLCRRSRAGALPDRRRVATASHLSTHPARSAAAAARWRSNC